MLAEIGCPDGAMHKFKNGTEIGLQDGAMHKIRLIEIGGSDGANHVVWKAADCHSQITQASGNVIGPWDFHLKPSTTNKKQKHKKPSLTLR